MIDFTSDFLIALWFACQNKESKDGKVFILNCFDTNKFSRVSQNTIKENIDHFFSESSSTLWYWIPERLNPRFTDQAAVFIFGEAKIDSESYLQIEVKVEEKKQILKDLEKFFDYRIDTLFTDKYAIGDIYKKTDMSKPEYLLEVSVYYIQTDELNKAIISLKKITENEDFKKMEVYKDLLLEANFQLGCVGLKKEVKKIENIDDTEQRAKEARMHINFLSPNNTSNTIPDYIKCFNECDSNGYKYKIEEINQIKKIFNSILSSFLDSPIQED